MAKQVIVLTKSSSESEVTYTCAMWYAITSGIRTQTAGSAWVPNGSSAGASAAENTAIQNGTVLEEVQTFTFPVSTPSADMEAYILQAWTNRNAQINGVGPNQYYGTFHDSTTGWGTA